MLQWATKTSTTLSEFRARVQGTLLGDTETIHEAESLESTLTILSMCKWCGMYEGMYYTHYISHYIRYIYIFISIN